MMLCTYLHCDWSVRNVLGIILRKPICKEIQIIILLFMSSFNDFNKVIV
jgi:hypothetical protein